MGVERLHRQRVADGREGHVDHEHRADQPEREVDRIGGDVGRGGRIVSIQLPGTIDTMKARKKPFTAQLRKCSNRIARSARSGAAGDQLPEMPGAVTRGSTGGGPATEYRVSTGSASRSTATPSNVHREQIAAVPIPRQMQ
jgi:hypothetical protein